MIFVILLEMTGEGIGRGGHGGLVFGGARG